MVDKEWQCISEKAKTLIKALLEYDAYKRITAEEALNHPWLKVRKKIGSCYIEIVNYFHRIVNEAFLRSLQFHLFHSALHHGKCWFTVILHGVRAQCKR